jgi:hypothetical protein
LNAGNVELAVELLEQGRGILMSAALERDRDVSDLDRAAPKLAERYRHIRAALGADDVRSIILPPDADRRYRIHEQWERLLLEIRALPGFDRFLLPPRLPELSPAASDGPVVIVNASRYRCDALALERDGPRVIPLPDLTFSQLPDRTRRFTDALRRAVDQGLALVDRLTAQDLVRETLEWLWDTVTGPVLTALDIVDPLVEGRPSPRIWWSPTGLLSVLPLHAAGHHTDDGPTVLDRVVSSYTPTVRALMHARNRSDGTGQGFLLMVALPRTPGHADLDAAHHEGVRITQRVPSLPPLIGDQATLHNVLDGLPRCRWAHFACHGHNDVTMPSTSHLLLHDGPLMITDLNRLRLPSAELAYLSACSTARTSTALAGEAIHLGTAFQLSGFPHVISTLWEVDDEIAARVANDFYDRLISDRRSTAVALHAAVRRARDAEPWLPTAWAAHVHIGP